jgi:hypothetical protein
MAEWPKAPDSKSGLPKGNVGSTPTLSSVKMGTLEGFPYPPAMGRRQPSWRAHHAAEYGNPQRTLIPSRDGTSPAKLASSPRGQKLNIGEMAEWPKAHDWKSCLPQGNVGSTPTLSSARASDLCALSGVT